jgi:hypothetical protein
MASTRTTAPTLTITDKVTGMGKGKVSAKARVTVCALTY